MALPLNVFKTVNEVAPTSPTTIYTAPTGYSAVVLLAQAANIDTATHAITVSHKRSSTVTELMKDTGIPGNDSMRLLSGRLVLEAGDELVLSASNASHVKVTVSILETLN